MRAHVLLLLAAGGLYAQSPFTIGAKVGVPFSDPLGYNGQSKSYIVSPSVELRLPHGFAIEASALYHRLGETFLFNQSPLDGSTPHLTETRVKGNSWEFPVVGKYYFRPRITRWQPFFGAGVALRTVGLDFESNARINAGPGLAALNYQSSQRQDPRAGATGVAGVRMRVGRFAFSPEVRYTRWGAQGLLLPKNETGLFVGFGF